MEKDLSAKCCACLISSAFDIYGLSVSDYKAYIHLYIKDIQHNLFPMNPYNNYKTTK